MNAEMQRERRGRGAEAQRRGGFWLRMSSRCCTLTMFRSSSFASPSPAGIVGALFLPAARV